MEYKCGLINVCFRLENLQDFYRPCPCKIIIKKIWRCRRTDRCHENASSKGNCQEVTLILCVHCVSSVTEENVNSLSRLKEPKLRFRVPFFIYVYETICHDCQLLSMQFFLFD